MPRRKPDVPSVSGVTFDDVLQACEEAERTYPHCATSFELTPNQSGAWNLIFTIWYRDGEQLLTSETAESWRPSAGSLPAFCYRAVIDTLKEVDRVIAKRAKDKETL